MQQLTTEMCSNQFCSCSNFHMAGNHSEQISWCHDSRPRCDIQNGGNRALWTCQLHGCMSRAAKTILLLARWSPYVFLWRIFPEDPQFRLNWLPKCRRLAVTGSADSHVSRLKNGDRSTSQDCLAFFFIVPFLLGVGSGSGSKRSSLKNIQNLGLFLNFLLAFPGTTIILYIGLPIINGPNYI